MIKESEHVPTLEVLDYDVYLFCIFVVRNHSNNVRMLASLQYIDFVHLKLKFLIQKSSFIYLLNSDKFLCDFVFRFDYFAIRT